MVISSNIGVIIGNILWLTAIFATKCPVYAIVCSRPFGYD